jgi:hypothetical protein
MANTIIQLKNSGATGNVPGSLAPGELAINYADGKLYYGNALNNPILFDAVTEPAGLDTEIQFNSSGSFGASANLKFNNTTKTLTTDKVTTSGYINSASIITGSILQSLQSSGDEGGEIFLNKPATNSTISGGVRIDVYQNRLRFWEDGSPNRGAYIDLTSAASGVGTNLLTGGGSGVISVAGVTGTVSNTQLIAGIQNVSSSHGITFDYVETANNGAGTNYKVGDDAWIGDTNLANTIRIKGLQDATQGYIIFGNNDGKLLGRSGSGPLTYDANTIWHAGNDGTGSGLDADLLDGQHGAYYTANAGAGDIAVTSAYQANVGAARIADVASGQANVGAGLISTKSAYEANVGSAILQGQSNVGAGLIVVTSAYEANVGAARIVDVASGQANVGAGLITVTSAYEANVGAARIIALGRADSAFAQANLAFNAANSKLSSSGGTISGDLAVTGNLTITGNTTTINVSSLKVTDSIIQLAVDNQSDLLDIGFLGHYANTPNNHTGLVRKFTDGVYYLFDSWKPGTEPTNTVDIANTRVATLSANLVANVIMLRGLDPLDYANTIQTTSQANVGAVNIAKVSKAGDVMTGALTTNSILTGSSLVANTTVTVNTNAVIESTTVTTSSTSQITLDSFATATYRSGKYLVQMTSGSSYHMIELSLIHDNTTVYLAQYGEVKSGTSLGTFDASISAGTLSVLFTPTNATTTAKAVATLIPV